MASTGVDLLNRDPNELNSHIKVSFDDVFGEPEDIHSMDCVWSCSYKCFELGKNCCYKLMTFLCGLCIALERGCEFAVLAFNHIWCWTPCMKNFAITMGCCQQFVQAFIMCCVRPCCEGLGSIFSQVKIQKS